MTPTRRDAAQAPQPPIAGGRAQGGLHRLLAEPLLHFFVIGAVVFGAFWFLDGKPEEAAYNERIVIDADDIRQIVVAWIAQGRAPPTRVQLENLIDQKIADEVLFREGLALGLDRNDEIIKRRVVQKMDFLAADIAAMQEPDRSELQRWFLTNSDRFALPPRASFRQMYYSPDKRGAFARDDAAAALDLIAGKPIDAPEVAELADPFMLRPYYSDSAPNQIMKEFGPVFAEALFTLSPGGWRGPIQSGYGWHLVWLDTMTAGRVPAFEEVEADVKSAWINDQYQQVKRAALDEMRSRYAVDVVALDTVDFYNLSGVDRVDSVSEPVSQ